MTCCFGIRRKQQRGLSPFGLRSIMPVIQKDTGTISGVQPTDERCVTRVLIYLSDRPRGLLLGCDRAAKRSLRDLLCARFLRSCRWRWCSSYPSNECFESLSSASAIARVTREPSKRLLSRFSFFHRLRAAVVICIIMLGVIPVFQARSELDTKCAPMFTFKNIDIGELPVNYYPVFPGLQFIKLRLSCDGRFGTREAYINVGLSSIFPIRSEKSSTALLLLFRRFGLTGSKIRSFSLSNFYQQLYSREVFWRTFYRYSSR
jgi:hypothetical protein